MIETVTRPHREHIVRWAAHRPEVLVLSADLTASCEADAFRDAYPDRFYSLGMAEQNMMGFAAGLAREGFFPYIHTFAVFVTRRPFDQVAMSIAYPNLPVRLVGFLPGLTTPGGVTHQAIDDVGLMRLIPNMTVLEAGDATEVTSVLDVAQAVDGPVYIRQLRGEVPRLFAEAEPMRLGCARLLASGDDLCVISSGICTEEAMRAIGALRAHGIGVRHLHVSTLKPFDDQAVLEALAGVRLGVVTMENHSIIGGLGAAVAELMAEHGIGRRLLRLGLKDTYAHGASRPYLLRDYGLDAAALVRAAADLAGEPLDIGDDDLASVRLGTMTAAEKTEDL
ncbi:MAG: transketolase [Thiohalocapsa sp.]|uniref:transketolase family protein n=1 Tax=Thiohalocapsa sp. TaxID=2497641 RepID=UPI0025F9E0B5|nr:transketolase C-terminal domain-containing protein [Thiohalocapsa sp.]MCG6942555.1 transketolase [Thiohalocapsa sp.]